MLKVNKFIIYILCIVLCNINTIYADDPFMIENIAISANTGDLVDSKSIALAQGSQDALLKLLIKLNATKNIHNNKEQICITKIQSNNHLVKDFVVKSERMTSRAYSAVVNIMFNKEEVKSLLNTCGLMYASVNSGETLLIPLIYDQSSYRIPDEEVDVELYKILMHLDNTKGLMHFKNALNSKVFDINGLDADIFIKNSYADLKDMLKSYDVNSALILSFKQLNTDFLVADIRILRHDEEYHESYKYFITKQESKEIFLKRVIDDILKNADLVWKRGVDSQKTKVFSSSVILELINSEDWQKIRNIFNKISIIKQYKFKTITNDAIELEIKYIESPEALSKKLLEHGVAIFKRDNNTLIRVITKS